MRRSRRIPDGKPLAATTAVAVLALAVWFGAVACATAVVPRATGPDAGAGNDDEIAVTLRIGESSTPQGTNAVITLTDVSDDSRCPVDVTCVWAGDATVTLRVQPGGGAAEVVALHIGLADSREATVAGLGIRLERLEPARRSDRPIARDQYRVVLAVRRQPPQEIR